MSNVWIPWFCACCCAFNLSKLLTYLPAITGASSNATPFPTAGVNTSPDWILDVAWFNKSEGDLSIPNPAFWIFWSIVGVLNGVPYNVSSGTDWANCEYNVGDTSGELAKTSIKGVLFAAALAYTSGDIFGEFAKKSKTFEFSVNAGVIAAPKALESPGEPNPPKIPEPIADIGFILPFVASCVPELNNVPPKPALIASAISEFPAPANNSPRPPDNPAPPNPPRVPISGSNSGNASPAKGAATCNTPLRSLPTLPIALPIPPTALSTAFTGLPIIYETPF